jgi:predicted nucleic-acid-binding protein
MIGIDANILIRYFTQDDPVQSAAANRLLDKRISTDNPAFVSTIALSELVWTLRRSYKLPAAEIVRVLRILLGSSKFVIESAREVALATVALEEGFGFSDALIVELGNSAGCQATLTFDRKAAELPGAELL